MFQNFFFSGHLDNDEKLLFVAHKHWVEILPHSIKTAVFGFIVPWTAWFFLPDLFWGAVLWTISFWFWYIYILADWYFDAWIATTASVIDVEWNGFFHQTSTRIPYSEIRDISWEIKGFWSTILRYGNASISMATGGQVGMSYLDKPKKVELQLIQIRDEFLAAQRMNQSSALQDLLSEMVGHHIEKKGMNTSNFYQ